MRTIVTITPKVADAIMLKNKEITQITYDDIPRFINELCDEVGLKIYNDISLPGNRWYFVDWPNGNEEEYKDKMFAINFLYDNIFIEKTVEQLDMHLFEVPK